MTTWKPVEESLNDSDTKLIICQDCSIIPLGWIGGLVWRGSFVVLGQLLSSGHIFWNIILSTHCAHEMATRRQGTLDRTCADFWPEVSAARLKPGHSIAYHLGTFNDFSMTSQDANYGILQNVGTLNGKWSGDSKEIRHAKKAGSLTRGKTLGWGWTSPLAWELQSAGAGIRGQRSKVAD